MRIVAMMGVLAKGNALHSSVVDPVIISRLIYDYIRYMYVWYTERSQTKKGYSSQYMMYNTFERVRCFHFDSTALA